MGTLEGDVKDGSASRIRALITAERESLMSEAEELVERFWDEHWAGHNRASPETRGYLGVRVRRRGLGASIEWYKTNKAFRKKGETGPARAFRKYLARGKGYEYPLSLFRKAGAKAWELEQIQALEPRFAQIRMCMQELAKLDRRASEYEKVWGLAKSGNCGESESGIPQEEEVDATQAERE